MRTSISSSADEGSWELLVISEFRSRDGTVQGTGGGEGKRTCGARGACEDVAGAEHGRKMVYGKSSGHFRILGPRRSYLLSKRE